MALGAFNAAERAQALDLLGFARQLVFATFSESLAFSLERAIEERYAAARAHNRAMAEFCGKDQRLMGVALLPLDDPQTSLAELEHILRLGLKAVWVPHRPCGGRSPGHDDLDPIWARLAEAGMPFVLHVARRAAADRRGVDEHRPAGADRLARHGRERARQGHDFAASARRDVRRRAWCSTACSSDIARCAAV